MNMHHICTSYHRLDMWASCWTVQDAEGMIQLSYVSLACHTALYSSQTDVSKKKTCSKGIVESYLSMSKSDFYTRWMQRFNIRTFYSSAGQGSANTLLRVCSTSWKPLFGLYFLQDPALCLLKWQHHLTWRLSYSDSIGGQNDRVTELCQCISPFVQTKYHKDFLQIAHGPSQPAKSIETHLYFDPTLTQQPLWGREFGKE